MGVSPDTFIDSDQEFLGLIDGGEDGEVVPLQPLLVKARNVDVIVAIDASADTSDGFAAGASLIVCQINMTPFQVPLLINLHRHRRIALHSFLLHIHSRRSRRPRISSSSKDSQVGPHSSGATIHLRRLLSFTLRMVPLLQVKLPSPTPQLSRRNTSLQRSRPCSTRRSRLLHKAFLPTLHRRLTQNGLHVLLAPL